MKGFCWHWERRGGSHLQTPAPADCRCTLVELWAPSFPECTSGVSCRVLAVISVGGTFARAFVSEVCEESALPLWLV